MCHNCGSAIAHTRGNLHSQHLCAACTTAYTWGYLATEGRAQAQERAPSVWRWFQRWGARERHGATSDTGVPVDGHRYETLL